MRVLINGVRLFVDIEGAGLVPDGSRMREKPTLILLHGGPGADHSLYKPGFSRLSDLCQIVYLDHRGNGRSDDGDVGDWTLDQWAEDLAALIDRLGITRPILYGASMGGFVAQAFATRYPERLGGLILCATSARVDFEVIFDAFTRLGGDKAGAVARSYWSEPTPERRQAYFEHCLPLYATSPPDPDVMARMIVKNPVAMHFNGPRNEMGRFDFRAALARVTCPTLVLSGSYDPMMPPVFSETILSSLGNAPATHHTIEGAGHMIEKDQPGQFFALLRRFIEEVSPCD
ncbi:MAG: alpha/beta hydrolase [Pseudomonadota bacterium]